MSLNQEVLVRGFVEYLKNTPEYREYQNQKRRISSDEELKNGVDTLRELSYRIQQDSDERSLAANTSKFMEDYKDLLQVKQVRDFLKAEDGFTRLVKDLLKSIVEGLELE